MWGDGINEYCAEGGCRLIVIAAVPKTTITSFRSFSEDSFAFLPLSPHPPPPEPRPILWNSPFILVFGLKSYKLVRDSGVTLAPGLEVFERPTARGIHPAPATCTVRRPSLILKTNPRSSQMEKTYRVVRWDGEQSSTLMTIKWAVIRLHNIIFYFLI